MRTPLILSSFTCGVLLWISGIGSYADEKNGIGKDLSFEISVGLAELAKRIGDLENSEGSDCPLCGQPMPAKERESLIKVLKVQGKKMGDPYRASRGSFRY